MRVFSVEIPFTRGWRMAMAILLLLCVGAAHAQTDDSQPDASDPPARVARLSYAAGDLGLMPAGSTQWSAADVNRPLTNGDKLSSGPGAKAELELGGAALRISGQSDIGVLNLNGQTGQFELTQGTANITVRNLYDNGTYEIDTPTLALVINQPGSFRIDVSSDGSATTVTVLDGTGMVYGENNAQHDVYSGRSYAFADSGLTNVTVSEIGSGDAFDAWCNDRDSETGNDETATAQYVSDDMVGAQDLDAYGSWQDDGDYGPVWYPTNVGVAWAPYRFGHWVWIAPWGWTWVDSLPWGFAPYHYGRWAYVRGRWGWCPGAPRVRPIYAPALVAFVGLGHGGPVGWFPLGPHDIYNPWYRASRGYYTSVNVAGIGIHPGFTRDTLFTSIHNQYGFYQSGRPAPGVVYANRAMPHAFTAVPADAFASARNVQASQVHMEPQQFASAAVMNPAAAQRPTAASFGPPRAVGTRPLPAAGFNRQVVAVGHPSPAVAANASFRAGQPSSSIHVIGPSRGSITPPRVMTGESARPANLPQVPRFEPAQQVQAPHFAAPQQNQASQQDRYNAAERMHEYVPQRSTEPNPSYEPYRQAQMPYQQNRAPEYGRPESQGFERQPSRPEPQQHSQNAPASHAAPPAAHNDNQH